VDGKYFGLSGSPLFASTVGTLFEKSAAKRRTIFAIIKNRFCCCVKKFLDDDDDIFYLFSLVLIFIAARERARAVSLSQRFLLFFSLLCVRACVLETREMKIFYASKEKVWISKRIDFD